MCVRLNGNQQYSTRLKNEKVLIEENCFDPGIKWNFWGELN